MHLITRLDGTISRFLCYGPSIRITAWSFFAKRERFASTFFEVSIFLNVHALVLVIYSLACDIYIYIYLSESIVPCRYHTWWTFEVTRPNHESGLAFVRSRYRARWPRRNSTWGTSTCAHTYIGIFIFRFNLYNKSLPVRIGHQVCHAGL